MSFTIADIHEYIDMHKEESLEDLKTIIRQPSVSAQNKGVRECAQLLEKLLQSLDMKTQILETKGQPSVYGELLSDNPEALTVLFYGHYDVQPPEPLEAWDTPPFEPDVRNDRIYGRGTADDKGQLLTHLMAIRAYQKTIGTLPVSVKVILEGEEESGSPNLAELVENHKNLLKADVVYASDGPMHDLETPLVLLGHRGVMCFKIDVNTAEHDNHSGNKGGVTKNAAIELSKLLAGMIDDDGHVLIDGFYDEVLPIDETKQAMIDKLPYDPDELAQTFGVESLPYDKREFYKRLLFLPTLSVNSLKSGYMGEGLKSIIPCHASAALDCRLTLDQDGEHLFETIRKHIEKECPYAKATFITQMLPCYTDPRQDAVQAVFRAVRSGFQTEPVIMPLTGGSLPSYVWTKILGIPYIGVPYGNPDENNHAPNENLGLENFYRGIHVSAEVIHELGMLKK